jgi:GLPGLI family protein
MVFFKYFNEMNYKISKLNSIVLILSFFLNSLFLNAQKSKNNIRVEYELILNTDVPLTKKGVLIINDSINKSVFFEISNTKENKIIEEDNDIKVIIGNKNKRFNYADYNNNALLSTESVLYDEFNVTESIPILEWKLLDSIKLIGNLECKLATTLFRGRNYSAWYTEKYPLKFGPWKFNRLPGLIVNIYDDTKRYNWIMNSIKKDSVPFNDYLISLENNLETISIKEFINKRYGTDINSRLKSKLPRNASVLVNKTARNSKEIKFEWEEDAIKD